MQTTREAASMDLETEILREHSKRQTRRIAGWIGDDARRFKQLMQLFLRGEYQITQRSAWIVGECFDHHPQLITPWLPAILSKMQEPGVHDAVPRNMLRILQFIEIPKSLLGSATTLCFDCLNAVGSPIAVKANAMTVLQRIVTREPDLKRELQASIELMIPYVGPALQARARIVLKELDRIPVRN
jgi:hypothetical protein